MYFSVFLLVEIVSSKNGNYLPGHSLNSPMLNSVFYTPESPERKWFLHGSSVLSKRKSLIMKPAIPGRYGALWNLDPLVSNDFEIRIEMRVSKRDLPAEIFGNSKDGEVQTWSLFYMENQELELIQHFQDMQNEMEGKSTKKFNFTTVQKLHELYSHGLFYAAFPQRESPGTHTEFVEESRKHHWIPEYENFFRGFRKNLPFGGFSVELEFSDNDTTMRLFQQTDQQKELTELEEKRIPSVVESGVKVQDKRLTVSLHAHQNLLRFCVTHKSKKPTCLKSVSNYTVRPGGLIGLTTFSGNLVKPSEAVMTEVFSVETRSFDESHHLGETRDLETSKILTELTNLMHRNLKSSPTSQIDAINYLSRILYEKHTDEDRSFQMNELYKVFSEIKSATQEWQEFLDDIRIASSTGGPMEDLKIRNLLELYESLHKEVRQKLSEASSRHTENVKKLESELDLSHEHQLIDEIEKRQDRYRESSDSNSKTIYLLAAALICLVILGLLVYYSLDKYEKEHFH